MVTIEDRKGIFDSISPLINEIIKIRKDFLERNKENILCGYWNQPLGKFYGKRIGDGLMPIYKLVIVDERRESTGIYVRVVRIPPDDDVVNSIIALNKEDVPEYIRLFLDSDRERLSWVIPFNKREIDGSLAEAANYVKKILEKKKSI